MPVVDNMNGTRPLPAARLGASQVRDGLLQRLEDQPGLCIQELSQAFSISRSAVRHHLKTLVREGLVVAYRQGKQQLHFSTRMPVMRRRAVYLLRIGSVRSVASCFLRNPRIHVSEVAEATGLTPRSVRRALRILEKANLLAKRRAPESRRHLNVTVHPEVRLVWSLYIDGTETVRLEPLAKHPMWFMGISAALRKFAFLQALS